MGNQVVFMIDAKHEAALRKWQQIQNAIDQTSGSIKNVANDVNRANAALGAKIDAAVKNITQAGLAFVGVGSAIGAIMTAANVLKQEYQAVLTRQTEYADKNVAAARGTRLLAQAFSGTPQELQAFKRTLLEQAHGAAPEQVQVAAGGLISAGGGMISNAQVLAIADKVTEYLGPDANSAQIEQFGRGVLEQLKKNKGLSVEAAIGNLIKFQQLSLASDVATVAKNAMPGVGSLQQYGWSQNRAMALMSAAAQVSGDVEMLQTATGATKAGGEWLTKLKQKHGLRDKRIAGMTMEEYIDFVRTSQDREAIDARIMIGGEAGSGEGEFVGRKLASRLRSIKRTKFKGLEEMPAEARVEKAIRDYFTPNWKQDPGARGFTMGELVKQNEAALPKTEAEAVKIYRESQTGMHADPHIHAQRQRAAQEQARNNVALKSMGQAISGVDRESLMQRIVTDTGGGWLESMEWQAVDWLRRKNQPTPQEASQHAIDMLSARRQSILRKKDSWFGSGPSQMELDALPVLEQQIKDLRELQSQGAENIPAFRASTPQPSSGHGFYRARNDTTLGPAAQREADRLHAPTAPDTLKIQVEDPAGRPMGRAQPRKSGIQGASE